MEVSFSFAAAATRPWPAISVPFSSTNAGFVQPHLRIDAAILSKSAAL
jgi:hypothetical protein